MKYRLSRYEMRSWAGRRNCASLCRPITGSGNDPYRPCHERGQESYEADQVLSLLQLLLKAVVKKEGPGLVICGKQAIDDDSNQTGQMLSALLGWAATLPLVLSWAVKKQNHSRS